MICNVRFWSAGGAGDEGGHDVGCVPVEGLAGTVIAHGGPGIGVAGRLLHIPERNAGIDGSAHQIGRSASRRSALGSGCGPSTSFQIGLIRRRGDREPAQSWLSRTGQSAGVGRVSTRRCPVMALPLWCVLRWHTDGPRCARAAVR
jgi:hypothetical protein